MTPFALVLEVGLGKVPLLTRRCRRRRDFISGLLAPSCRQQMRRLVFHEDHQSVAYPECHAKGLIPFCRENPALRVERQASLWRDIFLATGDRAEALSAIRPTSRSPTQKLAYRNGLPLARTTRTVAR